MDAIVDVRSRFEFWTGHLPGAVCVPAEAVTEGVAALDGVSRESRILVYCAGGSRSAGAAARLRDAGYTRVIDAGGIGDARREFVP